MINGIIFEERLNTAADWGRILKKAFPIDGVLHGFEVTGALNTFTVAPGYIVLCGRVLQNDGTLNVENTAALQSGYVRLKYKIDLSAPPSKEGFTQGGFAIDTSGTEVFPPLLKEDINGTGSVYEEELAVFQMVNGAIASRVRMLRAAGADSLYLLGEGGSYFAIRKVNGQIRLLVRGEGGAELAALKIDETGAMAAAGELSVGSALCVNGDISQTGGRATLNEAVTISGPETSYLKLRWAGDRVAFDISDGAALHENVMSINANGSVTIPVDVPGIQGVLDMNDDIVFAKAGKGVFSSGGGSKKQLIAPGADGTLWVGSTDDQFVSQEAAVAASGRVALMTYEPGKSFNAALLADGRSIAVNRNLAVGSAYNAAFGGDVSVGGQLRVAGSFGMETLSLSGALTVGGDTSLRKLTVGGDASMGAVSMEGNLTLARALHISGQYGIATGSINMLSFINNIMWLGSQSDASAPSFVNIAPSTQLNVAVGGVNMLKVDKEVVDAYGKTIKTTGVVEAGTLKVGSFNPASVIATGELRAPTVRSSGWLKADGKFEVDGISTFKGTIVADTVDITAQDVIAGRNLWVKNMQRFYPRGTALGYGATMEVDANNYAFSIYVNPSAGSDSGRLQAIKIDRPTGQVSFPRGINIAGLEIASDTNLVSVPANGAREPSTNAPNVFMNLGGLFVRSTSSRRYKQNIADADADEMMDTVRRLRVRNFVSKCKADDKKVRTGGIAEEFAEVDERLALTENGRVEAIDTGEVLYRLLSAVQTLDKRLAVLEGI